MFDKVKYIIPLAAALVAGAVLASPAFAQGGGGGVSAAPNTSAPAAGGGSFSAAPSGGSSVRGPSPGAHSGAPVNTARGTGRTWNGGGVAFNGHHHHHRGHGGFGFFAGAYPYGYYDDWACEPDCYLRRIRVHHHWVLRRYCY